MRVPPGRRELFTVLVVVALAAGSSCRRPAPVDPAAFNVVLVTLDTTRADRLGAYGVGSGLTPHLDAIAREGVVFEETVAQAPLTLPSHASIMTSRYPASHGVRHNGVFRLPDSEQTLAESLKRAGFHTAAAIGAFVLNRGFGIEQGFDAYDDIDHGKARGSQDAFLEAQRSAAEVNARAFAWLDRRPLGRFFLWVHYYDPHIPYAAGSEGPGTAAASPFAGAAGIDVAGYDREIASMDAAFGALVDRLRRDGVLDRTLLFVAADHGESLGEHREPTHGIFLYEPVTHVPMFARAPGLLPEGERVPGVTELIDIAPTVLSLLKLPPLPQAQGRDLVPRIEGRADGKEAYGYAETLMPRLEYGWSELRMVRGPRLKYIEAPRPELYDVRADPREAENLLAARPDDGRPLAARLESWRTETERDAGRESAQHALSADDEARLRSLGYLGGARDVTAHAEDGRRADPKDMVEEGLALQEGRDLLAAGDAQGALSRFDRILRANPMNHVARNSRVRALIKLDRLAEAEDEAFGAVEGALRRNPQDEQARQLLVQLRAAAPRTGAGEGLR